MFPLYSGLCGLLYPSLAYSPLLPCLLYEARLPLSRSLWQNPPTHSNTQRAHIGIEELDTGALYLTSDAGKKLAKSLKNIRKAP